MNKIVLRKKTSAIFLAIVLVAGTIALSLPSLMIESAQATSDREKDRDDNDDKKKSYNKDNDRDDESRDHDKYDNEDKKSYGKDRDRDDESRDYTDDNNEYDYESTKYSEYSEKRYNSYDSEYRIDKDYKDRYGKDSYESQYSSYGKDNSYKSKDSSSIKKVKCNNINLNLNGVDVDIGGAPNGNGLVNGAIAEAQEAEDEDLRGVNSYESNSGSNGKDVQSYSGTDSIVCINNNNNTVISVNETTPEPPEPTITCEECFTENLDEQQIIELERVLALTTEFPTLKAFCDVLSNPNLPNEAKLLVLGGAFVGANIDNEQRIIIAECLEDLGIIELPSPPT